MDCATRLRHVLDTMAARCQEHEVGVADARVRQVDAAEVGHGLHNARQGGEHRTVRQIEHLASKDTAVPFAAARISSEKEYTLGSGYMGAALACHVHILRCPGMHSMWLAARRLVTRRSALGAGHVFASACAQQVWLEHLRAYTDR